MQLLGKDLSQLNPDELRSYVQNLHTLRTSPQTFRASLSKETGKVAAEARKAKAKSVASDLLNDLL